MNVCLYRPYLHLSLSCLGVVGGAAEMLKYLNIFKNLKLVKLVFAVLRKNSTIVQWSNIGIVYNMKEWHGWWVVCRQTLRQAVAQLELELPRPCQLVRTRLIIHQLGNLNYRWGAGLKYLLEIFPRGTWLSSPVCLVTV